MSRGDAENHSPGRDAEKPDSRGDGENRNGESLDVDRVTGQIVDVAYHIHRELGPGLMESVYQAVLVKRLRDRGLRVEAKKTVAFEFDGMTFATGLQVDLLVDGMVVVELKSVENLPPVHWKQTLTYLRLLDFPVGLLLNFGGATMKEGIRRIVNGYRPSVLSDRPGSQAGLPTNVPAPGVRPPWPQT